MNGMIRFGGTGVKRKWGKRSAIPLRLTMWCFCISVAMARISLCVGGEWEKVEKIQSPIPFQDEFDSIKERAEQGDIQAQLYMGVFYFNGNVVSQNFSLAAEWYQKAAAAGNATAQRNLATLYDCGLGVERDYAEAVKWYRSAARQGEPAAFMGLGRFIMAFHESLLPPEYGTYELMRYLALYICGVETIAEVDDERRYWPDEKYIEHGFWKSYCTNQKYFQEDRLLARATKNKAELGDDEAQLRTAIFIFQGQGLSIDSAEFAKWLIQSAKTNSRSAFIVLANMKDPWYGEANSLEPRAYEMFSSPGYRDIDIEEMKERIVTSNEEQYFPFFLRTIWIRRKPRGYPIDYVVQLAESGYRPAENHIVSKLATGHREELADDLWYGIAASASARQHNVRAIAVEAYCLLVGMGTEQNLDKALERVHALAVDSDVRGLEFLQDFIRGRVRQCSPLTSQTLALLRGEANRENVDAAFLLGIYYQSRENAHGSQESREPRQSLIWLVKAANLGCATALQTLEDIYYRDKIKGKSNQPFLAAFRILDVCDRVFAETDNSCSTSAAEPFRACVHLLADNSFKQGYLPAGLSGMLRVYEKSKNTTENRGFFSYLIETESFSSVVKSRSLPLSDELRHTIYADNSSFRIMEMTPLVRGYDYGSGYGPYLRSSW